MDKTKYITVKLPECVIEKIDDTVKKSKGIFSSRADIIKQGTLSFIEEQKGKLNI